MMMTFTFFLLICGCYLKGVWCRCKQRIAQPISSMLSNGSRKKFCRSTNWTCLTRQHEAHSLSSISWLQSRCLEAWMNKTASKQDGPHSSAHTHPGTLNPSISQVPDLAGQHISCSGCLWAIVDQSLLALPLLMLIAPVMCKSQEAGSIIICQQAWWLAIACGTWSF